MLTLCGRHVAEADLHGFLVALCVGLCEAWLAQWSLCTAARRRGEGGGELTWKARLLAPPPPVAGRAAAVGTGATTDAIRVWDRVDPLRARGREGRGATRNPTRRARRGNLASLVVHLLHSLARATVTMVSHPPCLLSIASPFPWVRTAVAPQGRRAPVSDRGTRRSAS